MHLPSITRKNISQGLSDLEVPDLSGIERPKVDLSDVNLPKVDVSRADVGKALVGAATAAGIVQRRRSRWPFLLGAGIAVGLAGWAYMKSEMVRERVAQAADRIGEQVAAMRGATSEPHARFSTYETSMDDTWNPTDVSERSLDDVRFADITDMASAAGDEYPAVEAARHG